MYHQIAPPAPRGTPYRGLSVHPRDFRRQMHWLRRLGYQGLSIGQLLPYLRGERQGKVVGISFDDGFLNVLQHAAPVLAECGFGATNYFVAGLLGRSNSWDAAEGVPAAALMGASELRAWSDAGFEVGSHTLSHAVLPRLSPAQARAEIYDSRTALEQICGQPVQAFCYPYGKLNADLAAMVAAAGYTTATTTARGLARAADDFFLLPRVPVMRSTNILRFLQKCLTHLEDRKRQSASR